MYRLAKYYLLNGILEFWPDEHILIECNSNRSTHTLNSPTSRCLSLLLESRPKLVPQSDFYRYVWGEEGKNVSINTLHQNIALLRKGLRTLDNEGASVVVTIQRKGFKLSEQLQIEEIFIEEMPVFPENTYSLSSLDTSVKIEALPIGLERNSWLTIALLLYVGFIFLGVFILGNKVGFYWQDDSQLNSYTKVKEINGCSYYSNSKESEQLLSFKPWSTDAILSCKDKPYRYITFHELSASASIIACNTKLAASMMSQCTTYFYTKDVTQ